MGHMSPTILDMAHVFGLRPSGIIVDVTHDWALTSCPIAESSGTGSGTSASPFQLEYNSATFKGFIPYVKSNFGVGSSNANINQEHMYFLRYWLNKHAFPNKSKGVKVEWIPLVETLHNFDDVATEFRAANLEFPEGIAPT
ncbi:hypothetical protein ACFX16_007632 [Malus domestica]